MASKLEIAAELASEAGHDFYLYPDRGNEWQIESCRQVTRETFYRIRPTGRMTFHLTNTDRKGSEVS